MMGITSAEQIAELEPQKKVIGVFLATGYNKAAIDWLHSAWDEIHEESGENWHLLVPVREVSRQTPPAGIDVKLSARIREMYGFGAEITPALFSTTSTKLCTNIRSH